MHTILIADDQENIRTILKTILERNDYLCIEAKDGREALSLSSSVDPDLIILDIMMPGLDGFDVCERVRSVNAHVPVLFLSAKADMVDKRIGYRLGADDYMTKPFNEEELLLRVGALLRRADQTKGDAADSSHVEEGRSALKVGDLVVDLLRCQASLHGSPISLTPTEFKLLAVFASNPDIVLTKEDLIEQVWGENYLGDTISIPAHIRHIRSKIEEDPSMPTHIETIWGFGYRLNSSPKD
ncbi:response regulator transcription factor [Arabiibacter massiliensis]|uniref:response regulator transcription factor n=1 Tax=Arabiibacter massiliensis TaxID=1870985 RepID=UPI00155A25D6|nr:response regulator transcription factor [Arabiibacter massiliensis]